MSKLRAQVAEFMTAFDQPMGEKPKVPSDAVVRLRARLIVEECFEMLEAIMPRVQWSHIQADVMRGIDVGAVDVDFPEFIDALGDLDYVTEGARLACGVTGEPVADAIHAANMNKVGGPVDAHGKRRKPAGWTPPDIEGELKKQGWEKP